MVKINNKKLAKFLGYKAIRLLILLIVIAAISFIMIQLSPIDPVKAYLGQRIVSQEQLAIMGEYWGTNLSLGDRVFGWLSTLASGSMGFSLIYRVPVTEVIMQKFTASFILMAVSWIISAIVGRLILPAITLSIVGIASITMFTRDKLISVKQSDYVLFAKARGESFWGIIKNHGIRNILLPAITIQFMSFNELFGGTILVEQVFAYPGIGQATVAAGLRSDVPLLLGVVIISTIFVFVGNLIADMIYEYVDPRLRGEDDE